VVLRIDPRSRTLLGWLHATVGNHGLPPHDAAQFIHRMSRTGSTTSSYPGRRCFSGTTEDDSDFAKRYNTRSRTGSSAPPVPFSKRISRREQAPQRSHMDILPRRPHSLAPPAHTGSRRESISALHWLCSRADRLGASRFGPVLRCVDAVQGLAHGLDELWGLFSTDAFAMAR
jgi:hypothetical protein